MLARQLPSAKAKMTGADLKNPSHFLNRDDLPSARLGAPSAWMKEGQVWKKLSIGAL